MLRYASSENGIVLDPVTLRVPKLTYVNNCPSAQLVRVADYQFARRVADNSGVSSEGGSACETKSISTRRSAERSSERSVRASLSEGELPASLKAQLDRINQHQSSPSVVPEQECEIGKAAVAPRGLASPIWWTTRWRTRLRRARKIARARPLLTHY